MDQEPQKEDTARHLSNVLNRFLFLLLAGGGMAVIALATLTPSLVQYHSDRLTVYQEQKRLAALEHLRDQQQQLIDNAENPALTERIAINHFRYQPAGLDETQVDPLPPAWRQLELAVEQVDVPVDPALTPPAELPCAAFLTTLADQPQNRHLLLLFGSVLVLVSLVCFGRKPLQTG